MLPTFLPAIPVVDHASGDVLTWVLYLSERSIHPFAEIRTFPAFGNDAIESYCDVLRSLDSLGCYEGDTFEFSSGIFLDKSY